MSRSHRDKSSRQAFSDRLKKLIEGELKASVGEVASALGYQDPSTLRSAMAGRCGVDLNRLTLLASWSKKNGTPVNLHWLLTGDGSPLLQQRSELDRNVLSDEVYQALRVISQASIPPRS